MTIKYESGLSFIWHNLHYFSMVLNMSPLPLSKQHFISYLCVHLLCGMSVIFLISQLDYKKYAELIFVLFQEMFEKETCIIQMQICIIYVIFVLSQCHLHNIRVI